MSEDGERIATLEADAKNAERRVAKLEDNQRWGVLTVLGLIANAVFSYFTGRG